MGTIGSGSVAVGSVSVMGAGALWGNSDDLYVGKSGQADLTISNAGQVGCSNSYIAQEAGSTATIRVLDPNSRWTVTNCIEVGGLGSANLEVSNGGRIQDLNTQVARQPGSEAIIHVTDPGSLWQTSILVVGDEGNVTVMISHGGTLAVEEDCWIGAGSDAAGKVVVTGQNSAMEASNLLILGNTGPGQMTILDGARVESGWASIGLSSDSSCFVKGPDSVWENRVRLTVGEDAHGQLTISEGGRVVTSLADIAATPAASGSVVVTDSGSVWEITDDLYLAGGSHGPGGEALLRILRGGLVDANDVVVWDEGVVEGNGALRVNQADVYGTVKPGASIGTLTVEGDMRFESGSILEVEVDNSGNGDELTVTGDVIIVGGTVRPIPTETVADSHQYVIVEANSVSGQFDALDTALLDSFVLLETAELGYEPGSVLLNVTATAFDDPNIARTGNQTSFGSALQEIAEAGGSNITTALQLLGIGDAVRVAYDQLGGQTIPSLAPVTIAGTTRHVGSIAGRLRGPAGGFAAGDGFWTSSAGLASGDTLILDAGRYLFAVGNDAPVLSDKPWGAWGKGYGLYGDRESESGSPGYAYTVYGAAFGLDYRFTERLLLSFTAGLEHRW